MKKNRLFEDDWKQANDESKVAKMQLKNMQANIQELLNKIDSAEELDAWVQSYLTKADDYLDSVKKYVVFGQDEDTTVLQPTEIEATEKPATPEAKPVSLPTPMPPISGYDPDAEIDEPAMDLTQEKPMEEPEGEEPIEGPELPGEEEEIESPELPGEEIEDEEFPEDEEEIEDDGEDEEELPGEDDEVIEKPEELDLDVEIGGGEAVSEMPMPKPAEEDQLTYDDLDFYNDQEYSEEEPQEVK
jgi:hypothetical protein